MMHFTLTTSLALIGIAICQAGLPPFFNHHLSHLTPPNNIKDILPVQYVTQPLDHFDSANTRTWQQRYWYHTNWTTQNGPQFLIIGGETTQSDATITNDQLEFASLAKAAGASIFLLEHRFYGASQPTGDLTVTSLKYLTSEQALADVNAFITYINSNQAIQSPRWIVLGYSYSGALAAWARQNYPSNVYAAVASGATIQAVVEFNGYLEVVYNALASYDPDCAQSVADGMQVVNRYVLTSNGRSYLSQVFDLCTTLGTDADSLRFFFQSILGNYMHVVLNSGNNIPYRAADLNISTICQKQLNGSSPIDGMRVVNKWISDTYGGYCLDMNYTSYIQYYIDATANSSMGDYRAWIWQNCNEFGFFQTTDSPFLIQNFTGSVMPASWYIQTCGKIFSNFFTNSTVYSGVANANANYGGVENYRGTRVILPSGTNDPWKPVGILQSSNADVHPVVINETSHCADIYPPIPSDPPSLTAARKQIESLVLGWTKA